ncbi:hypothetical protein EG829_07185 [bacterium]|nr:hypothetical protein [bacterium]
MKLGEAAESFGIPAKVIARMEREGLIVLPLDDAGVAALSVMGQLWGRMWFVAESMKSVRSARDKAMLLLFPDFDKIDRYILKTFLGEANLKNLPSEVVKYRVRRAFSADVDMARVRKLRKAAQDIRRKKTKLTLGKLTLDYADLLGI